MKKNLVLSVLAKEIKGLWEATSSWKTTAPAYKKANEEILDLVDAYFEIRGSKGSVCGILGVDNEVNAVKSIQVLVKERLEEIK